MSIKSTRFLPLLLVVSLALLTAQGCGDDPSKFNQYDNFVAATKRADQEGWKPYWLGRTFTAGSLTFEGPGVGGFGFEIEGGGLSYNYDAALAAGTVGIKFYVYSPNAWAEAARIGGTRGPLGATIRDLKIAGHDAKLYVTKNAKQNPDGVRADIEIDGVVVRVQAGAATAIGGGNVNPLSDEATFINGAAICVDGGYTAR